MPDSGGMVNERVSRASLIPRFSKAQRILTSPIRLLLPAFCAAGCAGEVISGNSLMQRKKVDFPQESGDFRLILQPE